MENFLKKHKISKNLLMSYWLLVTTFFCGCKPSNTPNFDTDPSTQQSALRLTVAVVSDPTLAAAIRRHRGEWLAKTNGNLEIFELSTAELLDRGTGTADVVLYPSWLLGTLAERQWIIPVRKNVLARKLYQRGDLFPLLRQRAIFWGNQVMAIPLGSPLLVFVYRADLFRKLGVQPPATWDDYRRLVKRFSNQDYIEQTPQTTRQPWYPTLEPLAPNWAGIMLLAHASASAKHPHRYSTLFDIESMAPLIAAPPFVRALQEMVDLVGNHRIPSLDPAGVWHQIEQGHAAMAFTWPLPPPKDQPEEMPPELAFHELPASSQVYRWETDSWEPRPPADDGHVPLLAVSGYLGSVTETSNNAPTAFSLLIWMAETDIGASSEHTSPFRQQHVGRPEKWIAAPLPKEMARQYAQSLARALSRPSYLFALRIPGAEEYLAVLDVAVQLALIGKESPEEALRKAGHQWQEITKRHGTDAQRQAYRRSLGLEN